MNALKLFPKMVIAVGIAFALAGVVAAGAGIYINSFVGQQLAAQNIVTPEDASIPNAPVRDIPTALSMADIIQHHAADSSNGLTYAQMGRFAVEGGNPAGTNNADEALKDANGKLLALCTCTGPGCFPAPPGSCCVAIRLCYASNDPCPIVSRGQCRWRALQLA